MSNRHLWFGRLCRVLADMPDDVEIHVSSSGTVTFAKPGTLQKVADANDGELNKLGQKCEGSQTYPRVTGWSGN